MFVETNVQINGYGCDTTPCRPFDKSAAGPGVNRIDLLILHRALPSRFDLTIDAYRAGPLGPADLRL